MANTIKLKRGSGSDPSASDLVVGEVAIRTDEGKIFTKKDDGTVAEISGSGGAGGTDFRYLALRNAANDGAASYPAATFTLVTSGTTSAYTPSAANALLVSYAGVIQQPNTGSSAPSTGFAVTGSTIKFGSNIAAAPDFIIYQKGAGVGNASTITIADESSDTSCNVLYTTAATGDLAPKTGTNLTFNSSTGALTATSFVGALTGNVTGNASGSSGSCTGNAATATALATARTIGGVSFDGSANIDLPGVNAAGSQSTSGNAATATTSGHVTVTDNESTNENNLITFVEDAASTTGSHGLEMDGNLYYNPSSGTVTATAFAGDGSALTGISAGATGGSSDRIFWENGQTVTADYTISNNNNAGTFGPVSINNGVTVTIGDGEYWTIV